MSPATLDTGTRAGQLVLPAPVPGLYLRGRHGGFTAHLTASPPALCTVRRLTSRALLAYGVGHELAAAAQLVVSELVGNAIRACGEHVPLVVEVYRTAPGAAVTVHDPAPELLPQRSDVAMDDDQMESGRGLALLDVLAPGWSTEFSLIGKQIRCHLNTAE